MTKEFGTIQIVGKMWRMNSEIVKTLGLMCDKNNPQDKKLLLLAELVETRCDALSKNQGGLKESLDETNSKLDKLTELLEKYEKDTHGCPVYKNKKSIDFDKILVFVKYPKLSLLVLLGTFALLVGVFSSGITSILRFLFGV